MALFVYVPTMIRAVNSSHFTTSHVAVLGELLLVALPLVLLAWVGLRTAPASAHGLVCANAVAAFLWVVISASLFPHRMVLDGERELVADSFTGVVWPVGVALALWVGLVVGAWRFPAAVNRFASLFGVAIVGWIALFTLRAGRPAAPAAFAPFGSYSPDRNAIVVLLDMLQGDLLEDVLRDHPEVSDRLAGFTFFPWSRSTSRTTVLSIPTIHAGEDLQEGEKLSAWFARSVTNDSFVNRMAASGYRANVLYPLPQLKACPASAVNCVDASTLDLEGGPTPAGDALMLFGLSVLRIAPGATKSLFVHDGHLFTEAFDDDVRVGAATDLPAAIRRAHSVLDRLALDVRADARQPVLQFVHVLATHAPAEFDGACAQREAPWTRATAEGQALCALRRLTRWFDALREKGVYDRSLIVLLSDHGAGFAKSGEREAQAFAHAFMMVKPVGAVGALVTSARVPSLHDVGATVCIGSGACVADRGQDVLGAEYRAVDTVFHSFESLSDPSLLDEAPKDELFTIGVTPGSFDSWNVVAGGSPRCDGTASFDWRVHGLTTFGEGWVRYFDVPGRRFRMPIGARSEVFVCLGEQTPSHLDIRLNAYKSGRPMEVYLDGRPLGHVDVPLWPAETFSLPLGPGILASGEHSVVLQPGAGDRPPGEFEAWAEVYEVSLR